MMIYDLIYCWLSPCMHQTPHFIVFLHGNGIECHCNFVRIRIYHRDDISLTTSFQVIGSGPIVFSLIFAGYLHEQHIILFT